MSLQNLHVWPVILVAVEDTIWSASSNLVLIARSVTARSVKYLQRWLAIPVVVYPGAALPPEKSLSLEEESARSKFSELPDRDVMERRQTPD